MTLIGDLNLSQKQRAALEALHIFHIEDITDEILKEMGSQLSSSILKKMSNWKINSRNDMEELDYTDLTFGQRLEGIRREIESIQKKAQKDVTWSAVLFDDLLEKVRPLFIKWGISWHTSACEIYDRSVTQLEGGLIAYDALLTYTIRFQSVEAIDVTMLPASSIKCNSCYRDVVVATHAFDVYDPQANFPQGDKGPGKAHTYAQKYALRIILNLPAGDDPDFIPMAALSTRARMERETLIGQLQKAIEVMGQDPDEVIPKWLKNLNEHYSRSITSIEDADDDVIRRAIFHFEEKARGN